MQQPACLAALRHPPLRVRLAAHASGALLSSTCQHKLSQDQQIICGLNCSSDVCCAQPGWYGNKLMAGSRAKAPRQRLRECRQALALDSLPPDTLAELQPFLQSQQLLILSHTAIRSITPQQNSSGRRQIVNCVTDRLHAQAAQQADEFKAWGCQSVSSSGAGCDAAEGRDAELSGLAIQPDALPDGRCGAGPTWTQEESVHLRLQKAICGASRRIKSGLCRYVQQLWLADAYSSSMHLETMLHVHNLSAPGLCTATSFSVTALPEARP